MTQPPVPPGPPPPPSGPPGPPAGPPAGPPPTGPGPSGPMPGSGPAPGFIVLTLQGSAMTSNVITPKVRLNGYPVPTSYGENSLPVPPGRWHVDVHNQWMRAYGQAAIDVEVASGQAVRLFYAAPWHQFTTGSIGYEQQKRKGAGFMLGLSLVMLLIVLGVVLLSL